MPEFSYIARTQDGVRKEDVISATNIKEASDLLVADNLSIVKLMNAIHLLILWDLSWKDLIFLLIN